jgi:Na+/H+ antiporter NhaC
MGLACVLMGLGVYGIIYIPVYEWIRLFRFIATDILAVLIRSGLGLDGTDILTGLGLGLDGMMIFVLGARSCVRTCTRARACAELRVYTSTVPS